MQIPGQIQQKYVYFKSLDIRQMFHAAYFNKKNCYFHTAFLLIFQNTQKLITSFGLSGRSRDNSMRSTVNPEENDSYVDLAFIISLLIFD